MTCFNEKNQHIGKLEKLITIPAELGYDVDAVVRWCKYCGAVVVDKEVDNRVMGRYVDMKFPNITKKALGV